MRHEVAPFAWTYDRLEIPPKSEHTVTSAPCVFPAPMNVVMALPHMHQLGTGLHAAFSGGPLDGQRFLDSRGYDPDNGVMTQYHPAIDLSQKLTEGAGMTFSCTWRNTFDKRWCGASATTRCASSTAMRTRRRPRSRSSPRTSPVSS